MLTDIQIQIQNSQSAVLPRYSESDYHWLVGVLDALIEFMHRDENRSVPELTENDYDWAHALLVELVGAVGESETHPLRSLMEFVCRLIDNYEDKYVPELTELFPELAEENLTEVVEKNSVCAANPPKLDVTECAARAFFSIGCLLWEGGKAEKALSAYDTAIRLQPDFTNAYANRGQAKVESGRMDKARSDFQKALELAEQQGDDNLKAFFEERLQELKN